MSSRSTSRWSQYHRLTAERPSRELLRATLRLLGTTPSRRLAVDLGCGAGVESLELLRQGWSVLAVDASPSAIEQLRSAVPQKHADRLKTKVARAESLRLPSTDLVWAGASLPFVSPDSFPRLWRAIVASLKPGGAFAGDFFGPRHSWASSSEMSIHSSREVRELCRPLIIESFVSERGRRATAMNGIIRWHAFSVIARKPSSSTRARPRRSTRVTPNPAFERTARQRGWRAPSPLRGSAAAQRGRWAS